METYAAQVDTSHYARGVYRARERWVSYWHQLDLVRRCAPHTLLEIGPGPGVVTQELRRDGVAVTTLDIAADLKPDVVGSITALPFANAQFDLILAAEVLEHIRWEDVPQALGELSRVARSHVVVSVPHPGWVFLLGIKIPLVKKIDLLLQIPFFWKQHTFDGQHYWELGKRHYPTRAFIQLARRAGLRLVSTHKYADDPVHRLFVFEHA